MSRGFRIASLVSLGCPGVPEDSPLERICYSIRADADLAGLAALQLTDRWSELRSGWHFADQSAAMLDNPAIYR